MIDPKKNSLLPLLMVGQSRKMADEIVNLVIKDQDLVVELMDCFFDGDLRICQRAAWPVGILAEKRPEIIKPYLNKMLKNLDHPKHDAVVRNTLRTFQFITIPEALQSEVYDRCLEYIHNPKYPIAFSAFSMTVCADIAMLYPELREEVISVIEYRLPNGSSGMVARGRKEIKRLSKS